MIYGCLSTDEELLWYRISHRTSEPRTTRRTHTTLLRPGYDLKIVWFQQGLGGGSGTDHIYINKTQRPISINIGTPRPYGG